MAVITKITTQQKNKERYNIYLDFGKGEEFAFSVDEAVLIKFQLKKGKELDDFVLTEITFEDNMRKAYNAAISHLAKRIRSKKEIKDNLQNKNIAEPIIQEVIHKLEEQKYLDDREYAYSYMRTQVNTTDKGPELIRKELRDKGIDQPIIAKVLEDSALEHQLERVKGLCEKFIQKNKTDSSRLLKQKLENLLVRKGYKTDIIQLAFQETDFERQTEKELAFIRIHGEKAHRKFSGLSGFEYQQKMKQTLYRKGFPLEVIEKFLCELGERND